MIYDDPRLDDVLGLSVDGLTDRELDRLIRGCQRAARDPSFSPALRRWCRSLAGALVSVEHRRDFVWRQIVRDPSGVPVTWDEAVANLERIDRRRGTEPSK